MTVFVDTNVIVYAAGREGRAARRGAGMLIEAAAAAAVDARTSTGVLEEVWHLELSRRLPGIDGLAADACRVFTPLLPVTEETLQYAMSMEATKLGANDRIHAAVCILNGIEVIVSADAAFDGVPGVVRVDPADMESVEALIQG